MGATSIAANEQDTAVGFHRSWFPLALAADLEPGKPLGRDVLGTRVVIYRDAAGRPVAQEAYCPHMGADLSVGQVIEGQIRCAYHHWRFDCSGRCVDIPAGDRIPPGARIATYPTAEAWGLIWAFNGEQPDFPIPGIPGVEESELVLESHVRGTRAVDPWVAVSNGVDFQHLRTLHGLPAVDPDAVHFETHAIDYRVAAAEFEQDGRITGVNTFSQHLAFGGNDAYMLFTGAPIAHGQTMGFYVYGVRDTGRGAQDVAERLESLGQLVRRLLAEDAPVLDTIRFRPRLLVASDRHLARFFKYVREFPRTAPPDA